jgi:hypothetical protein
MVRRKPPATRSFEVPPELLTFGGTDLDRQRWGKRGDPPGIEGMQACHRRYSAARRRFLEEHGLPPSWWWWWTWPEATRQRYLAAGIDPPPRPEIVGP